MSALSAMKPIDIAYPSLGTGVLHYQFRYEQRGQGFILIWESENPDAVSLTNSAAEVIRELAYDGLLTYEVRGSISGEPFVSRYPVTVLYQDSEGRWDEMRHDGRRFKGFRHVGGTSWEDAIWTASRRAFREAMDAFKRAVPAPGERN